MRNFEINPIFGFLGAVLIGCIIGHWFILVSTTPPKEQQPQIKPCECLNYYQWTYWSTKRDRVLNKRKRTRTDSLELRNADRILGISEILDNPPKR